MQSALPLQLGGLHDLQELRRSLTGKIFLAVSATAFVALCAHVSLPLVLYARAAHATDFCGTSGGPHPRPGTWLLRPAALSCAGRNGSARLQSTRPRRRRSTAGAHRRIPVLFPLAAAAAGSLVRTVRPGRSQFPAALLAGAAASVLLFAMGAGWTAHLLHLNPSAAWQLAIAPFLPGEILKVSAAAGAYTMLRRWRCT